MKIKAIVILSILIVFVNTTNCQNTNVSLSSGGIYSDITTWDEVISSANSGKIGYYFSTSIQRKVWRNFHLKGQFTFLNKKPLEVFVFQSSPDQGPPGLYIFENVPTSQQSDSFDPTLDKSLNNFKFLGLSLVPSIKFKYFFEFEVGLGLFHKWLINTEAVKTKRGDIPSIDSFFEPPFSVSGEVEYRRNDFGWISNFRIYRSITKQLSIGLENNLLLSFNGMHNPYPATLGNPKWIVNSLGIICIYDLENKERRR